MEDGGTEDGGDDLVDQEKPVRPLVHQGPEDVPFDDVPDARIERPTDALVTAAKPWEATCTWTRGGTTSSRARSSLPGSCPRSSA